MRHLVGRMNIRKDQRQWVVMELQLLAPVGRNPTNCLIGLILFHF